MISWEDVVKRFPTSSQKQILHTHKADGFVTIDLCTRCYTNSSLTF